MEIQVTTFSKHKPLETAEYLIATWFLVKQVIKTYCNNKLVCSATYTDFTNLDYLQFYPDGNAIAHAKDYASNLNYVINVASNPINFDTQTTVIKLLSCQQLVWFNQHAYPKNNDIIKHTAQKFFKKQNK